MQGFIRNPKLISKMRDFANSLTAETVALANTGSQSAPTEFTTTNTTISGAPKKGGVPRDSHISLMDDVIDFKDALNSGDYQEAQVLYFRLKRKVGG